MYLTEARVRKVPKEGTHGRDQRSQYQRRPLALRLRAFPVAWLSRFGPFCETICWPTAVCLGGWLVTPGQGRAGVQARPFGAALTVSLTGE
jgi:hypothetical protein